MLSLQYEVGGCLHLFGEIVNYHQNVFMPI